MASSDREKIPKVPMLLREMKHNSDAYDPKAVSFGPYHHGKPELQLCQNAKRRTLQMFLHGSAYDEEFYKGKVSKEVANARSCYVEGSTGSYTDDEFVEMMLLDACFLIYFMVIVDDSNSGDYMNIFKHLGRLVDNFVNRDIFLLENQIPFQVVKLLIQLRYGEKKGEEALFKLLHKPIWDNDKEDEKEGILKKIGDPLHLLEACHRVLVWDSVPEIPVDVRSNTGDSRNPRKTFRSALDLKAKGIHFKPSKLRSLKSIKFESRAFHSQLELPVWFVSQHSKVIFQNMIAYELRPDNFTGDKTVTSYLTFMKSLIGKPADVKELREKKVLLPALGNDEDVVEFYRTLDTFEIGGLFSYPGVKDGIQRHYDSKLKTWKAELIHTYLSSPWSIIAWVAALFLLILTFLQTYFTVADSGKGK